MKYPYENIFNPIAFFLRKRCGALVYMRDLSDLMTIVKKIKLCRCSNCQVLSVCDAMSSNKSL